MNHTPEFQGDDARKAAEAKRQAMAEAVAAAYARLFLSDDGKVVLEDLRRKFGHDRDRFTARNNYSTVGAAVVDGQCQVLREIELAIKTGRRGHGEGG